MKKIIGILSITTLAMAMFFNTNAMNKIDSDFNLSNLLTLNTANASSECDTQAYGGFSDGYWDYEEGGLCCEGVYEVYCVSVDKDDSMAMSFCQDWNCA